MQFHIESRVRHFIRMYTQTLPGRGSISFPGSYPFGESVRVSPISRRAGPESVTAPPIRPGSEERDIGASNADARPQALNVQPRLISGRLDAHFGARPPSRQSQKAQYRLTLLIFVHTPGFHWLKAVTEALPQHVKNAIHSNRCFIPHVANGLSLRRSFT